MKSIRLLFALLLILSIGACSDFYLTFTEETGGGANSEASADAEALDVSDFTFTGSESAGTVESDFTLPTSGESGNTTITWASDAPYVSISGGSATVVAPAGTDTVVTLTAIITDGDGNTATKEITVTVLAITEAQAVTNVINWLWYEDGDGLHSNAITLTGGDIDELQISQDFTLTVTDPWYGSTIAWTSATAAVAITGANAVVTAPLTGTIGVNLNTTVTIGAASQSFSATPYGEMSIQIQGSSFSPIIDTGNTAGTSFVFDNMVLDSSGRAIISGRSGGAVQVYADNGSGDWAALGNPSANTGDKVSMTIDGSDHVYIAYTDSDNSNAVYVQEWDGASWTVLGGGAVSDVNALYPHVINSPLSDGQLWLTYNESDDFISVQTWTGAAWSTNINTVSGIDINSSLGAGPGQFRPRATSMWQVSISTTTMWMSGAPMALLPGPWSETGLVKLEKPWESTVISNSPSLMAHRLSVIFRLPALQRWPNSAAPFSVSTWTPAALRLLTLII